MSECYDYHFDLVKDDTPKIGEIVFAEHSEKFERMAFMIFKDYLFHLSSKTSEYQFHHASTYAIEATKHFIGRMEGLKQ